MRTNRSALPHEVTHRCHLLKEFDSAQNDNWLVEARGTRLVLRRYMSDAFDDIPYELDVMRRLQDLGWPVPELVDGPVFSGLCSRFFLENLAPTRKLLKNDAREDASSRSRMNPRRSSRIWASDMDSADQTK